MSTVELEPRLAPAAQHPAMTVPCHEALEAVKRALHADSGEPGDEAAVAARALVRLRDGLIDRLRAAPESSEAPGWRDALDRVNVALSLVAGIEYPAGGMANKPLEAAHKLLIGLAHRKVIRRPLAVAAS
jgi:hypothetical protein